MSQLLPFLAKLRESGADRVFYAPNEDAVLFDGDRMQPLPGGPVPTSRILEAVSELLSNEDIRGLSTRPRIVRHQHDGVDYVLEIVRHGNGVALGIRLAAKGRGAGFEGAAAVARPPTPQAMRPAGAQPASERTPAARPAPEGGGGVSAEAVRQFAADVARQVALETAKEVGRQAIVAAQDASRQVAIDASRQVASEVAHSVAAQARDGQDGMREEIERIAREIAADEARAIVRDALRDAGRDAGKSAGRSRAAEAAPARSGPAKIDGLLREMLQKKGSDLHLTAGTSPVLRADGEIHFLRERGVLSSADITAMIEEIFTPKARNDFAELHDADFAHEIPGLARFRVNVFQDRHGTGAVLRQIPIEILSAEKLGLSKAILDLCWLSKGLVLVTGPTGSGKSTTLAAMIDFINKNRSDHIITIEDPVEFVHQNQKCLVNQREVGQHTKSFKNALRAALREDPDIVLVGEMRDLETIAIAIETAETGHLVFGTLHTTTAISTVDRIIDQFPSDRQEQIRVMLSESLKGVVAQVLCPKIGGGRVAAHEVLLSNHAVASLIREGKTFQLASTMQTAKGQGMVTMNDSLFALVQKKLVDPKAAYMKAVDKTGFVAMLKNAGIPSPV